MNKLAFCSAYSLLLALLPIDIFLDRENYLVYAQSSWTIFTSYLDGGVLRVLSNEPLWLLINAGLGYIFSPEIVLRLLIFISAFITSYLVMRNGGGCFLLILMILFLPQVIKNNIVHLRQGLAISIFLLGWFVGDKRIRYALFCAVPFIHASFFFVSFIYIVTYCMVAFRLSFGVRIFVVLLVGLLISFSFIYLVAALEARQADIYLGVSADVSGLAFVFWMFVLMLFILEGNEFLRANAFPLSVLAFYLSTYFFMPVAARIFESSMLLVMLAGLKLQGWRVYLFVSFFIFYFAASYFFLSSKPLLGFGL